MLKYICTWVSFHFKVHIKVLYDEERTLEQQFVAFVSLQERQFKGIIRYYVEFAEMKEDHYEISLQPGSVQKSHNLLPAP